MSTDSPRGILTQIGAWTARPTAFVIVALYAAAMVVFAPHEVTWHSVATLATWLMTLFIQRAEHRDTQAIQAKLDELLRSHAGASDALTRIDRKEPEEIERERDERTARD
jgi:low affinity Fe/Cu permease